MTPGFLPGFILNSLSIPNLKRQKWREREGRKQNKNPPDTTEKKTRSVLLNSGKSLGTG